MIGRSKFFERYYPHLDGKFTGNGVEKLAICALGANEQYYARWTDGSWSCYAYETTVAALKEVVKKCKKKIDYDIQTIALGYGASYLISYGRSTKLRYKCELKTYYPQLQQVLEDEKPPLNVLVSSPYESQLQPYLTLQQAVTLNPRSKSDYILVYSKRDGGRGISWICSNPLVDEEIRAWVHKTLGIDSSKQGDSP